MSVLIEAISVVARRAAIEDKYPGGLTAFKSDCPNSTFCADEYLVRIGFMTPEDVEGFVRIVAANGLAHLHDGAAVDLVVIDQLHGPTTPCDWIEAGRHPDGYSAAWLAGTTPGWLAVPDGWAVSQSRELKFVPSSDAANRILRLTQENGIDVVLDLETGRQGYIGRVSPPSPTEGQAD